MPLNISVLYKEGTLNCIVCTINKQPPPSAKQLNKMHFNVSFSIQFTVFLSFTHQ